MGDFFLDFRRQAERNRIADESLRFFPDIEIDRLQNDRFDLMLTRSGSADMWVLLECYPALVKELLRVTLIIY
jgi:hypothetical protein